VLDKLTFQYDLLETADLSYWSQVTAVPISLKTSTWLYSSSQINANTQGSIDLNVLARAQSCKKILMRASSAHDPRTGIFGSANPNARAISMYVGSTSYPQTPLDTSNPSIVRQALLRAFGAANSHQLVGSIAPFNFCKRDTADAMHQAVTPTTAFDSRETASSNWMLAIDLETCPSNKDSLFQGTALSASSASYMRMDLSDPLTYDTTVHFLIHADAVLILDAQSGTGRLVY
jgi:hypothetical protein